MPSSFDPQAMLKQLTTWPFLQEPIWRWFVFIIVLSLLLGAWNGALRHMRGVV
jgi:hypothetical protein